MAEVAAPIKCAAPGCDADGTQRCPKCVELNFPAVISTFCSPTCFKAVWGTHKAIHIGSINPRSGASEAKRGPLPDLDDGFAYTGPLRRKVGIPQRRVPDNIVKPDYADNGVPLSEQRQRGEKIQLFVEADIARIRRTCQLTREVLDIAAAAAKPGVTTDELDRIVFEAAVERECYPSALNYHNFPKSCCTSINEVICHGIPDGNELCDGDLLKLDVSLFHDGVHGDLCETYAIGNISERDRKLAQTAYNCLQDAIDAAKPGFMFRDVGNLIQKRADKERCHVVKRYCGHGVGPLFHSAPTIPHYAKNKASGIMQPGMVFTIEPMIAQGTWRDVTWADDWSAASADGSMVAQFEHTMVVTKTGVEVLTARTPSSRADFV